MIKVFYGDDRVRANREIKKILGENYEVLEGPGIIPGDLPSIFLGSSLFSTNRNILIRDLSSNPQVYDQIINYLNTPHNIIIFETKLDKRTNTYKKLKEEIEFREFNLSNTTDLSTVFNIYKVAKTNGKKAVEMLEKIKFKEDPIMFFGLLASQALKDFSINQGKREKSNLKLLAKLDMELKSTKIDPWLLVESFL